MRWAIFIGLLVAAPAYAGVDFTNIGEKWNAANEECRGGLGDSNDTWIACGKRDAYAEILVSGGLCYDEGKHDWRSGERIPSSEGTMEITCR